MPTLRLPERRDAFAPLVECTRGSVVESLHHGALAVHSMRRGPGLTLGDVHRAIYPRSTLKPFQSVAMVRAGLDLPEDLLALSAASHSGARAHRDGARRILQQHGLRSADLRNAADLPYGAEDREAYLRAGGVRSRLVQNCSGKHAAMLATCVVNGWPLHDYLHTEHPLQQHVLRTLGEFLGEPAGPVTVDGCGSPLPPYPLAAVAQGFARLVGPRADEPERAVVAAMRAHPHLVAGEGRDVTALMRAFPSIVVKDGAEAVQLLGLAGSGVAVAIKIADGSDRALLPLSMRLLRTLGVAGGGTAGPTPAPVRGGGRSVGVLRVTSTLEDALSEGGAGV